MELSIGEWESLDRLKKDNAIVIKPADQRSAVIVMDREQ